jgi:hypothetical protein
VLVAGLCVFARQHWAVSLGIVLALVQAIFAFFWLFTGYWQAALVTSVLDMLVIHGLASGRPTRGVRHAGRGTRRR